MTRKYEISDEERERRKAQGKEFGSRGWTEERRKAQADWARKLAKESAKAWKSYKKGGK